eukprot:1186789-Prorocentrum_minimum.AAC.4
MPSVWSEMLLPSWCKSTRAAFLALVLLLYLTKSCESVSWSALTGANTGRLQGLHFKSRLEGWAVGNADTIVHTTDGGNSWTRQNSSFSDSAITWESVR